MDDTRDPHDGTPTGDAVTDDAVTDDAVTDDAVTDDAVTDDAATDDAATDAAVARVRAADPAAGAVPDEARLRARLADVTGESAGAAPQADELAAARARRRAPARWLQVAAVAAGVALVGGGGYAVGASGAPDPAAPPIALQGADGGAGPAQELAAADARSMMEPGWFGGRTVFSGSGLDGAAGSARAWALDATSAATAGTAARVAEVLGVPGEPRLEWGQWVVGTNDGLSATVQVGVDGQAGMWFYDRAWDPSVCTSGSPETLDGSGSTGAADGGLAEQRAADQRAAEQGAAEQGVAEQGASEEGVAEPDVAAPDVAAPDVAAPDVAASDDAVLLPAPELPAEPAPADPSVCDPSSTPTGDAAVARARDLLTRLGVDVAGFELSVTDDTGVPGLVSVTAAQVLDGTQTGLAWSVQLAGTGVQSVSGPLATLVELGTYEHVSADDAVERLNDPRFGASYGGMVPLAARAEQAAADDAVTMPEQPAEEPTVPPVPAAGDPLAWPVQDVTITAARLGVTLLTTPTGATLLVPAWELSDADGGTWSVIAVVEDQLDLGAA